MKHLTYSFAAILLLIGLMTFVCGCGSSDTDEGQADGYDATLAGIPELEQYMGGWGTTEGDSDCNIVLLTEENGMLKVEFAAISGGGHYVLFDANDISIEGDTVICVNGYCAHDAGTSEDGVLVISPYTFDTEQYQFRLISGELGLGNGEEYAYHYYKVGEDEEELNEWIDEHHDPL